MGASHTHQSQIVQDGLLIEYHTRGRREMVSQSATPESCKLESVVRGHHIYKPSMAA